MSGPPKPGVHVNVGLTPAAINQLGAQSDQDAIDQLYLQAAVGFMRYRWLLTYLFGATPFAFDNYFSEKTDAPAGPVRSLRNSHFGFGNGFLASYRSVSEYVRDIEDAVTHHDIIAEREYYGTVRLKRSADLEDLLSNGILYVELRIYDLDPFEPLGISEDAVNIVQLMFAYFTANQPFDLTSADDAIVAAHQMNDAVSLEDPRTVTQFHDEAIQFVETLKEFSRGIALPFDSQALALRMIERIDNPQLTPSARLTAWAQSKPQTAFNQLLSLAQGYQNDLLNRPLYGFENRSYDEQQRALNELKMGHQLNLQ